MGCCNGGNIVEMTYDGSSKTLVQRSISMCEQLPVDVLEIWKRKIDCVIDTNQIASITGNPVEVTNAQTVINEWIAAKHEDPATCAYYEYLPLMQDIVNKCIIKGICI